MKFLCLGNNTENTDQLSRELAAQHNLPCHGIIDCIKPVDVGVYHTSVVDLEIGSIKILSESFDRVIVLDQPKSSWEHPEAYLRTIRLAQEIPNAEFVNPKQAQQAEYFQNLVATNASFCIYPFIELLVNNGDTTVCCRSSRPVTKLQNISNFATDAEYVKIRSEMLAGRRIPHCEACYQLEDQGVISSRQQETVEWANRLNLDSVEDLVRIQHPVYYEVRASNTCNLQCRTCTPSSSHLIEREYQQIKIIPEKLPGRNYEDFDFVNLDTMQKIYMAGGEPTAMPKFYDFLDRCITQGNTCQEFIVNTNATKLSDKFKKQLSHFNNFQFIVSIDGYHDLNHYIRWPSKWSTIIDNVHWMLDHGHYVSINTTVSIYNVTRLSELLKFFDQEFPGVLVHLQPAYSNDHMLDPLNNPCRERVLQEFSAITNLQCYRNDQQLRSYVDSVIKHYRANTAVDLLVLDRFFEFNDRLDQSRNIYLKDYVPELDSMRMSSRL